MKRALVGLSLAAALALAASSVQAATVTVLDTTDAWQNVNLSQTTTLPGGGSWTAAPTTRTGNITNVTRSPFDGTGNGGADSTPADWEQIPYFSVGPSNPANPSILDLSSDRSAFNILWGSIDNYNTLQFYNNLVLVATVTSLDLVPPGETQFGAAWVSITGLIFDRVVFTSSLNAFEFSNIQAVPLPPALLLFGSALALGYLARKRRQTTGPVQAA
jgi:hypothetical protein